LSRLVPALLFLMGILRREKIGATVLSQRVEVQELNL
jgi:hypothetical protein